MNTHTHTDNEITDNELDARLRDTFATVMPLLDGPDTKSANDQTEHAGDIDHEPLVFDLAAAPTSVRHRRTVAILGSVAAVALVIGGLAVLQRDPAEPPAVANTPLPSVDSDTSGATQEPAPTATEKRSPAPALEAPVWYDTIRPLLPDGFDQIVLTDAMPEVVGFKAFRTGTRQLLDVTITLQSGYGMKDTGEAATFSDDEGDYIESAGSVALTTPGQRQVIIRCGLRPIGGGSVETGGLLDADRDTCNDGVDNLDIDPVSLRTLAGKLASEFPTDAVTPVFGQPDTGPAAASVSQIISDFVGEDRPFSGEQARGVLRDVNLSATIGEPSNTELTVIQGMWPPNGDGSALDETFADSPQGRFHLYGDIAVAFVVVETTGYHIATTDLSDAYITALGELLQQLSTSSSGDSGDEPAPILAEGPITVFENLATGDTITIVDDEQISIAARYESMTTAPYCVDLRLDGFSGPACVDATAIFDGRTNFAIPSDDGTRQLVGQIVTDLVDSIVTSDGRTITPSMNVWWDVAAIGSLTTYTVNTSTGRSTEAFSITAE